MKRLTLRADQPRESRFAGTLLLSRWIGQHDHTDYNYELDEADSVAA